MLLPEVRDLVVAHRYAAVADALREDVSPLEVVEPDPLRAVRQLVVVVRGDVATT
jgi:hypothetical protein